MLIIDRQKLVFLFTLPRVQGSPQTRQPLKYLGKKSPGSTGGDGHPGGVELIAHGPNQIVGTPLTSRFFAHPDSPFKDNLSNHAKASSQVPRVAARLYSVARFSKKFTCSTPLTISSTQGRGLLFVSNAGFKPSCFRRPSATNRIYFLTSLPSKPSTPPSSKARSIKASSCETTLKHI